MGSSSSNSRYGSPTCTYICVAFHILQGLCSIGPQNSGSWKTIETVFFNNWTTAFQLYISLGHPVHTETEKAITKPKKNEELPSPKLTSSQRNMGRAPKGSSSNHPFCKCKLAVSFREGKVLIQTWQSCCK